DSTKVASRKTTHVSQTIDQVVTELDALEARTAASAKHHATTVAEVLETMRFDLRALVIAGQVDAIARYIEQRAVGFGDQLARLAHDDPSTFNSFCQQRTVQRWLRATFGVTHPFEVIYKNVFGKVFTNAHLSDFMSKARQAAVLPPLPITTDNANPTTPLERTAAEDQNPPRPPSGRPPHVQAFFHNVYAPVLAPQRPAFFASLPRHFPAGAIHIIGGDFNLPMDVHLDAHCRRAEHNQGKAESRRQCASVGTDTVTYDAAKAEMRQNYKDEQFDLHANKSETGSSFFFRKPQTMRVPITTATVGTNTVTDPAAVASIFTEHWKAIMTAPSREQAPNRATRRAVLRYLDKRLSDEHRTELDRPLEAAELCAALKTMNPAK
ncbi:hypothetical protein DYB28_015752, partial [Aphanomyces astaci]